MCIFSGEITEVAGTKILVGRVFPTKVINGRHFINQSDPLQLVVYSNEVAFAQATSLEQSMEEPHIATTPPAMILPFPLRPGQRNRVSLLDLSKYTDLFEDLDLLFPESSNRTRTNSYGGDEPVEFLKVHHVGSYHASIVPNLKSFDRLQIGEFNLAPDCQEILQRYYPKNYGFIVCRLSGDFNQVYSPFGYVHELRGDGKLFIPTRHYHRHTKPSPYFKYRTIDYESSSEDGMQDLQDHMTRQLAIEDRWIEINARRRRLADEHQNRPKDQMDWDHIIYVFNVPQVVRNPLILNKTGVRVNSSTNLNRIHTYINLKRFPEHIGFDKFDSLHQIHINSGYKYNLDMIV